MIEMELVGVRVELPSSAPIVLVARDHSQGRLLPIFIGGPEATAIALAMDQVETPRPMTHDLFKSVLDILAVRVEKVIVTDIQDKTFFAELEIGGVEGEVRTVSSRPSDAIALAVRTGTPIFVAEQVLTKAGYTVPDGATARALTKSRSWRSSETSSTRSIPKTSRAEAARRSGHLSGAVA